MRSQAGLFMSLLHATSLKHFRKQNAHARRNSFECLSEFSLTQATQFLCRGGLYPVYLQEVLFQSSWAAEYPITDGAGGFPSSVHTI